MFTLKAIPFRSQSIGSSCRGMTGSISRTPERNSALRCQSHCTAQRVSWIGLHSPFHGLLGTNNTENSRTRMLIRNPSHSNVLDTVYGLVFTSNLGMLRLHFVLQDHEPCPDRVSNGNHSRIPYCEPRSTLIRRGEQSGGSLRRCFMRAETLDHGVIGARAERH